MRLADGTGFPVALSVGSASPHEVYPVEETLDKRLVDEKPERLIGDRAYDSDPLDEKLTKQGVQLTAPHKSNRKKPKTQDGRVLRRHRRRWKVERLFAWLQNYRRILVRFDRFRSAGLHPDFHQKPFLRCVPDKLILYLVPSNEAKYVLWAISNKM